MGQSDATPIHLDECRDYVDREVFRLQPQSYGRDYPKWPGLVGIEIEMLPWRAGNDPSPNSVPIYGDSRSLSESLVAIAAGNPRWACVVVPETNPSRLFRVHMDDGDQLSFEPGGQLEISTLPYPCLSQALNRAVEIQKVLDEGLGQKNIQIIQTGINPWHTTEQIGLQMEKKRYQCMTQFFNRIGPYGVRMMRQTCTVQVNLDFGPNEGIMTRRFLASQLIAPFATATFAYSPIVDGKPTPYKSFRGRIWHDVDPSRTGFPALDQLAKTMTRESALMAYFDLVMNASVVFIAGDDYVVPPADFTFKKWLEGGHPFRQPTLNDFKTHLSLMFPEVRARGFIELRSVDCQARAWQSIPAAYYTGLLYDSKALDQVLELLRPQLGNLNKLWHECVYGMRDPAFKQLAHRVFQLAIEGFDRLPSCFRETCAREKVAAFCRHFTEVGRSPADDLLDLAEKHGTLTPSTYSQLENQWQNSISNGC